jgi:hypothetical protein
VVVRTAPCLFPRPLLAETLPPRCCWGKIAHLRSLCAPSTLTSRLSSSFTRWRTRLPLRPLPLALAVLVYPTPPLRQPRLFVYTWLRQHLKRDRTWASRRDTAQDRLLSDMAARPSSSLPGIMNRPGSSHVSSAFAMPLSPDDDVNVNWPEAAVHHEDIPALLSQHSPRFHEPVQPFPLPAASARPLPTPDESRPGPLDFDFAPSTLPAASLPTPSIAKVHNLRLPSFETLGIAAPHPDRIPLHSQYSFSSLGAGPLSKPEDPLHALSPLGRLPQLDGTDHLISSTPLAAKAHIEQLVSVVTPPSEPGMLNWGAFVNVRTAGVGSPPSSDPGVSPILTTTTSATQASGHVVPMIVEMSDAIGRAAWVEDLKQLISMCIPSMFTRLRVRGAENVTAVSSRLVTAAPHCLLKYREF